MSLTSVGRAWDPKLRKQCFKALQVASTKAPLREAPTMRKLQPTKTATFWTTGQCRQTCFCFVPHTLPPKWKVQLSIPMIPAITIILIPLCQSRCSHYHLTENYYIINSETIMDVNNYIPFSIINSQTIDVT